MRKYLNSQSGQLALAGLGVLLLFVGIVIIVFLYTPLAKQIFGFQGQLSQRYLYIGIAMIVLGLILGQRGIKRM